MREPQPIVTTHLFAPLNDELVALLRSLHADDWSKPTVAGAWSVRDVAAHLLDTSLRRLSLDRDDYAPPLPDDAFANGLGAFINNANREGVEWLRRLSAPLLIDLLDRYGREMAEFFASKDPDAPARWAVSWAGDETSPNWFDIAREFTERWHHQQQIRDAVGAVPLFAYLAPVLDAFVRALPLTYRGVPGTLVLRATGEGDGAWTVIDGALFEGESETFDARVTLRGDALWRVFTKQRLDPKATIEGDRALAERLFGTVAIVA
ncbi:MAG TPA: maleylpyruvate isomerase N-terminal domain-containing protein [Thermoanaerobaculia bacterium]|nr:maleylpyruvate isomerase N-terminal domain-containing protein [Thermoanaerobaculia bacterium]